MLGRELLIGERDNMRLITVGENRGQFKTIKDAQEFLAQNPAEPTRIFLVEDINSNGDIEIFIDGLKIEGQNKKIHMNGSLVFKSENCSINNVIFSSDKWQ
jgi:hypothetical protein